MRKLLLTILVLITFTVVGVKRFDYLATKPMDPQEFSWFNKAEIYTDWIRPHGKYCWNAQDPRAKRIKDGKAVASGQDDDDGYCVNKKTGKWNNRKKGTCTGAYEWKKPVCVGRSHSIKWKDYN